MSAGGDNGSMPVLPVRGENKVSMRLLQVFDPIPALLPHSDSQETSGLSQHSSTVFPAQRLYLRM